MTWPMPPATSMVTVPSASTAVCWRTAYTIRDTLPAPSSSELLVEQPGSSASPASRESAPAVRRRERCRDMLETPEVERARAGRACHAQIEQEPGQLEITMISYS